MKKETCHTRKPWRAWKNGAPDRGQRNRHRPVGRGAEGSAALGGFCREKLYATDEEIKKILESGEKG